MLLATFNCNSVRSRLQIILDWLQHHRPYALALQETKVQDRDFPASVFRESGWHVSFRGQKSYNGVAVLSRDRPDEVRFGLGGDDGESDARMMWVRFGGINLVNTYVPQGRSLDHEKFRFKLAWLARLRDFFNTHFKPARDKVVWLGDLNIAPQPMDVHDHDRIWPHVCHCRELTEIFDDFVQWGFVDVFRKHLPGPGIFTFWDYRVRGALERGMGWRIDHVLATRPLAKKSKTCFVDLEPRKLDKPSDHTFVGAEFQSRVTNYAQAEIPVTHNS